MRYVVFEAGSRAGLSAQLFFSHYQKMSNNDDTLTLVDADKVFVESISKRFSNVLAVEEKSWFEFDNKENVVVFPADELTRQKNPSIAKEWWNEVKPYFYDKRYVNCELLRKGINAPMTFCIADKIIVKPNKMSAGSKNISFFDDVCVSERIDIAHEYVVDCFVTPLEVEVHARETKLKNGYDKYVKLLDVSHPAAQFALSIVNSNPIEGMFIGPCHLQVAEDFNGEFYYIEGSKRISGTSLVEMCDGYNPFFNLNDLSDRPDIVAEKNVWYSYEQLFQKVWRNVYGQ